MVDLIDAEGGEILVVVGDIFFGHLQHGDAALECLFDQFVVDVGNVDDPGHVVSAILEVALDAIEDDGSDHVANVGFVVDGGAAKIDADATGLDGAKWLLLPAQRVIDAEGGVGGGDGRTRGHRAGGGGHGMRS
jgi:hypothetical protein